jgi:putative radical SAM enzyme (TIGR03279 family)
MPMMKRLIEGGIELHTQIVVCPGINDGEALEKTIADLYKLSPGILSLAVVPIGLTGHRLRLPELRTPTAVEAKELIGCVNRWQKKALAETGSRFIFVADEFYLQAGVDFPPLETYEDLPQIENGIGQVALFRSQSVEALLEAEPMQRAVTVSTFTGESFYPELQSYLEKLAKKTANSIHIYKIENKFFSGQVTVTGLLTGQDLLNCLRGKNLGEALLVPDVLLREGEDIFLDDMTLDALADSLGVSCVKIPSTPWGILDAMEDLSVETVC